MNGGDFHPWVYPGLGEVGKSVQMERLTSRVADRAGLDFEEILSPCRRRELVTARYALYYLFVRREKKTYKRVGAFFNRDHSTVVHGVKTWTDLITVGDTEAWEMQQIVNSVYHQLIFLDNGEEETP